MKQIFSIIVIMTVLISCTRIEETQYGVITEVEYKPAHNTTVLVPVSTGKVTTLRPQIIHHSASWNAKVCYNDSIYVTEHYKHSVNVGDSVKRNITIGYKYF